MPPTSRLGLDRPATSDPATALRTALTDHANTLDAAALRDAGTLAARPTATSGSPFTPGFLYEATDTGQVFLTNSTGTAWIELPAVPLAAADIAGGAITAAKIAVLPRCRLRQLAASPVVGTGAVVVLAFGAGSEIHDTDGMHDTSTNSSRITVQTAGAYEFAGGVQWEGHASGDRTLRLRKNGSAIVGQDTRAGSTTARNQQVHSEGPIEMAAGDYVELLAVQTSGVTLNVETAADYSPVFAGWFTGA